MPLEPSQPTITILLLLASATSADALTAGDHSHLFVDLCTLITLNKRQFPDLPDTQQATSDYQQIQKLNASLSSPQWRRKFEKTGEGDARHQYKPEAGKQDDLHKKRWASWADAEAELEKENPPKLKAAQLKFSTKFQRLQYLVSLQPLAEQAAAAAEELQTIQESSAKLTATELKKELKEAAFGPGIENENQLTEANIKSSNGAATTRKDLCGGTTGVAKARTIAAFIYYICAGEQTDSSGAVKYCENTQAANNNAGSTLTGVDAATKDLISKCPDKSQKEISSAELLTQAAQFQEKSKQKTKELTLATSQLPTAAALRTVMFACITRQQQRQIKRWPETYPGCKA
ncbi:Trypanosomal VSG domain containing protein, putative [Trypanosoma equiperdum]|uniref:Trypanosomal VSG domain containing protein, putative n=1 Tax=Trypanosoma equiperdum TaxID=5694 RepID=A0A1G4I2F3_TRYEQ|nr:Trypanosomal VSG domain containing protein, putative [Trypanosoma equiperdum]